MKRPVFERLVGLALVAALLLAYGRVVRNGFVNYDDLVYVVTNDHVHLGLSWDNIRWAFFTTFFCNWHPLTWLSYMADYQFYGLNPAGFHLTSLFFHVANTLLVFLFLRETTGRFWESAMVAALFGLHPLHVESVAWVSERKDVLSGFFGMLTLLAYYRYSLRPCLRTYLVVITFFALGLMSKAMLVTFPFLLLLLDYWPLARFNSSWLQSCPDSSSLMQHSFQMPLRSTLSLIIEKLPLLAMSALCSVLTYRAQFRFNAVVSFEALPLRNRICNIASSYLQYLEKTFWPENLAAFYPYFRNEPAIWKVLTPVLIILALTGLVVWQARRMPFFLTGWFWFLGTLVPVIGIVQVGSQAMADRYTYIPSIGILIPVVWGWTSLLSKAPNRKALSIITASLMLAILGVLTWKQTGVWRDTQSLFGHAVLATSNNYMAHAYLGGALVGSGQLDQAEEECNKALKIMPTNVDAINTLGTILAKRDKNEEAIHRFDEVLKLSPRNFPALIGKGGALARVKKADEAALQYSAAAELMEMPDSIYMTSEMCNLVGIALANLDKEDEAMALFQRAMELAPQRVETYNNLGRVLTLKGRTDEAISQLEHAISLSPCYSEAYNNLGLVYLQAGYYEDAIVNFSVAINCRPDYIKAMQNLEIAIKSACTNGQNGPSVSGRSPDPTP